MEGLGVTRQILLISVKGVAAGLNIVGNIRGMLLMDIIPTIHNRIHRVILDTNVQTTVRRIIITTLAVTGTWEVRNRRNNLNHTSASYNLH